MNKVDIVISMDNTIVVDVQIAEDLPSKLASSLPSIDDFSQWLELAYQNLPKSDANQDLNVSKPTAEINIRIVSCDESQQLNHQYRGKDKPTNVLSFESDLPDFVPSAFLGDLVICAQVVDQEALEQNKKRHEHWAHMSIHGLLHLVGFDHIENDDAEEMEGLEISILAQLGIDDPYQIT
jgi:probable rRNA maturation factor